MLEFTDVGIYRWWNLQEPYSSELSDPLIVRINGRFTGGLGGTTLHVGGRQREGRRHEAEGRRQEAGGRRQEAGGRRQEAGSSRQQAAGSRQEKQV